MKRKSILALLMLVLTLSFTMFGCAKSEEEKEYTISLSVSQGEGTIKCDTTSFSRDKEGEDITTTGYEREYIRFEAVPANGYVFESWSDGNTQQFRSMNLNSDIELTAKFVKGVEVKLNNGKKVTVLDAQITEIYENYYTIKPLASKSSNFGYWENVATGEIYKATSTIVISTTSNLSQNLTLKPQQTCVGAYFLVAECADGDPSSTGISITTLKTINALYSSPAISRAYYYKNTNGSSGRLNVSQSSYNSFKVDLYYKNASETAVYTGKIFTYNGEYYVQFSIPFVGSPLTMGSMTFESETYNISWHKI